MPKGKNNFFACGLCAVLGVPSPFWCFSASLRVALSFLEVFAWVLFLLSLLFVPCPSRLGSLILVCSVRRPVCVVSLFSVVGWVCSCRVRPPVVGWVSPISRPRPFRCGCRVRVLRLPLLLLLAVGCGGGSSCLGGWSGFGSAALSFYGGVLWLLFRFFRWIRVVGRRVGLVLGGVVPVLRLSPFRQSWLHFSVRYRLRRGCRCRPRCFGVRPVEIPFLRMPSLACVGFGICSRCEWIYLSIFVWVCLEDMPRFTVFIGLKPRNCSLFS